MEDSDVITILTSTSLPENSIEITTEPELLDECDVQVAESVEVCSTDESIICLDEEENTEASSDTPFYQSSTNLPVIIPYRSESPSNENDDDFSIVYEKKAPPVEVEILENYRSPNLLTKKKHRKSQNGRLSDQREDHKTNQEEVMEQTNPSLDDSIYVVDQIVHVAPSVNHQSNVLNTLQQAVLNSTEKKKRKIECGVCFDGPEEIEKRGISVVSTVCGHIFCSECITMSIKSVKHCPQCRKKLTMKQFHVIYV